MNRTIKFRAWDGTKMILDFVMLSDGTLASTYNFCGEPCCECQGYDILPKRRIDPDHIMQSTGLFDKNGVEIFRGDIIEWNLMHDLEPYDLEESVISEVIFDQDKAQYCLKSDLHRYADERLFYKNSMADAGKVIGNIFTNPELIN